MKCLPGCRTSHPQLVISTTTKKTQTYPGQQVKSKHSHIPPAHARQTQSQSQALSAAHGSDPLPASSPLLACLSRTSLEARPAAPVSPRRELGSQVSPSKERGDICPAHPGEHKESSATTSTFSQNIPQTTFLKQSDFWPFSKRSFRLTQNYQAVGHQRNAKLGKAFESVWDRDSKFPKKPGARCFFHTARAHIAQSPLNSLGQMAWQNTLSPSDLISSQADS